MGKHSSNLSVSILVTDRLDRSHHLVGWHGQPMKIFLLQHSIPSSAVILTVNGELRDDQEYVLQQEDQIKLEMVRAYQLPEYCRMLGLWEGGDGPTQPSSDSIYSKSLLWFHDNGICKLKTFRNSSEQLPRMLEQVFIDGIMRHRLIEPGDTICLPLSGGRDSLALLYLLQNCKDRLPLFKMVGVTVSPIAASDNDLDIAAEAVRKLGVEDYHTLSHEYVAETMGLRAPFNDCMGHALNQGGRGLTISLWHGIMTSCIERFCHENDLQKIAFGYQQEDLVASVLRSRMLGTNFGETIQRRNYGDFELISPLWPITKKELTIYLKCIAPIRQSSQGSPTRYDRGDHNRDIHYFLADQLSTLYPGFAYSFFQGYNDFNQRYQPTQSKFIECSNCGVTSREIDTPNEEEPQSNRCTTCTYLTKIGLIKDREIASAKS
jgi:tRNA(Ile)-lysidine synthase TilS/MesJ